MKKDKMKSIAGWVAVILLGLAVGVWSEVGTFWKKRRLVSTLEEDCGVWARNPSKVVTDYGTLFLEFGEDDTSDQLECVIANLAVAPWLREIVFDFDGGRWLDRDLFAIGMLAHSGVQVVIEHENQFSEEALTGLAERNPNITLRGEPSEVD